MSIICLIFIYLS